MKEVKTISDEIARREILSIRRDIEMMKKDLKIMKRSFREMLDNFDKEIEKTNKNNSYAFDEQDRMVNVND